ncbi:hypothetical protein AVEN_69070-1, partial [Araneus ventricosus]
MSCCTKSGYIRKLRKESRTRYFNSLINLKESYPRPALTLKNDPCNGSDVEVGVLTPSLATILTFPI